jgi:carboxyl-terminal processing protease
MNNNNLYLWIIVLLSLFLGFTIGSNQQLVFNATSFKIESSQKLIKFIQYIESNYVDEIDIDSLVNKIIDNSISQLDPHSVYIPGDEMQKINEEMQGTFVGIGVSFFMEQDTVSIVRVLEKGPSKAAGILPGDRILIANQDTLYGQSRTSASIIKTLKGKPKTTVQLKIYRKQTKKFLNFDVERGEVPIPSVYGYLLTKGVGYIQLNRFAETSGKEFKKTLNELKLKGAKKLVLDLRDNPGGYLHIAEEITDAFLSKGKIMIITQSNQGKRKSIVATGGGLFEEGQVYVLINGQSASASEVVAGALQDNDRAHIIGRRSFGKGLVQQQIPLGSGDAIRLTTARYYTPTGRSIQRPFNKGKEDYYDEIGKRYETGEIQTKESIPVNDSLKYITPKGRVVYGGGGIIPDEYVPGSLNLDKEWDNYIIRSNLVSHFVFLELDKNRSLYDFKSKEDFIQTPLANKEQLLEKIEVYFEQQGVSINMENEVLILNSIKSFMALQLFNQEAFLQIVHSQDEFINKTKELLNENP